MTTQITTHCGEARACSDQAHASRGSKGSDFEGGTRIVAYVSGGFLPKQQRGMTASGYMHVADWLATFSDIIGEDPTDHKAAKAGLPPIDRWVVYLNSLLRLFRTPV